MEFSKEDKVLWEKVIVLDLMSSEESDFDGEDILSVHPLSWRASRVDAMFKKLDDHSKECKSPQALHQTKKRCVGTTSTRRIPDNVLLP